LWFVTLKFAAPAGDAITGTHTHVATVAAAITANLRACFCQFALVMVTHPSPRNS
jgi:hypothetical protein